MDTKHEFRNMYKSFKWYDKVAELLFTTLLVAGLTTTIGCLMWALVRFVVGYYFT